MERITQKVEEEGGLKGILNGRKSASATIVLGIRRHAFNTITCSAAEFRNPKTLCILKLNLSVSCLCLHFS